jgi:serine/threonine protein kinase
MSLENPLPRLGKYQLLELLGAGATAEVYRALDRTLEREVALKLLKPSLVGDTQAFERFLQEARGAARLFHPNVATVLEVGESDGRYYIAMRYIPGKSLDKLLAEQGRLSWEEALRMAQQIGAALDFAHGQGFLHRDVKPSNIIRTPEGDFVLTDFGLVKAMMATGLTTQTGALLGTPPYMAPEVWRGKPASPATDVYSLACVFHEMVSGQVLFAGESPAEVVTKHVLEGPQFADGWAEGLPDGVEAVLLKALAKEPTERYATAGEFVEALEGLQKGEQPGTTGAGTSFEKPSPAEHFTIEAQLPIGQHLLSEGSQPAVKPLEQQPISLIQPRLTRFAILFVVLLIALGIPLAFFWRRSTMPAPPSFSAQTATSLDLATGWLEEAHDGLFYTAGNQEEEIQLKSGEFLPAADRLKLRTAASSARLRLRNGSVLQLQPNTALTLQPGANPLELDEVELLEGKIIIRSQSFPVKVSHFPVVVRLEQGILGMDFVPELGSLRIACLGGSEQSCTLQSPTGTLNLPVGQEFGYTKGLPWATFQAAEFVYWQALAPDLIVIPALASPSPTTFLATETARPQATHTSTPTLTPFPTHTPTKTPLQPSSGDREVPESGGGGSDSGGGVPYP